MQVTGNYSAKPVQAQVTLQGIVGREIWLGVDLLRGGGGGKVTLDAELQRRNAGDVDWLARLRGRGAGVWRVTAGYARA